MYGNDKNQSSAWYNQRCSLGAYYMSNVHSAPLRQPTKTVSKQCLYRAVASSAALESTANTATIEAQLKSDRYAHLSLAR